MVATATDTSVGTGTEPAPELVTVISECRLVDGSGEQWTYWRRNGKGLAPGWYVVTRPRGEIRRHFNDDVEFRGPFGNRARAELLLAQLVDAHRRLTSPDPAGARLPVAPGSPPQASTNLGPIAAFLQPR